MTDLEMRLRILWIKWAGEPEDCDYSPGGSWYRRETIKTLLALTLFLALCAGLSMLLAGCAGRRVSSSTDERPCAEGPSRCWEYVYVERLHEWGWCRQEDTEYVCRMN